jgi:hypothetical protein
MMYITFQSLHKIKKMIKTISMNLIFLAPLYKYHMAMRLIEWNVLLRQVMSSRVLAMIFIYYNHLKCVNYKQDR